MFHKEVREMWTVRVEGVTEISVMLMLTLYHLSTSNHPLRITGNLSAKPCDLISLN